MEIFWKKHSEILVIKKLETHLYNHFLKSDNLWSFAFKKNMW